MKPDDAPEKEVHEAATEVQRTEGVTPIIVDAGRKSRKAIRRLKEGRGTLMREVNDIVNELRSRPGSQKGIVPVVIIYRQKSRQRSSLSVPLIPSPFDLFR